MKALYSSCSFPSWEEILLCWLLYSKLWVLKLPSDSFNIILFPGHSFPSILAWPHQRYITPEFFLLHSYEGIFYLRTHSSTQIILIYKNNRLIRSLLDLLADVQHHTYMSLNVLPTVNTCKGEFFASFSDPARYKEKQMWEIHCLSRPSCHAFFWLTPQEQLTLRLS